MIWHFFEIWLLIAIAFCAGSGLGALLYAGLSRGRLAEAQGAVADVVGDAIDGISTRLGIGPEWRPGVKRAAARTSRENRQFRRDADFGGALGERFSGGGRGVGPRRPARTYWQDRERGEPAFDSDDPVATEELSAEETAPIETGLADLVEELPGPPEREVRLLPQPELPAMRPAGLAGPRNGVADNLQRIRGIGRRNEQLLNSLGIFHFGQIAAWTPAEARWVAAFLAFPERIERDDWIGQATILASGGDTGFHKPVRDEPETDST